MPGRAELLHMLRDHLGRETGERANWIAAVIDEIGE